MNARNDCERFQDLLDGLPGLALDERAELDAHAARCGECAAMLEIRMAFLEPPAGTLEDRVPDGTAGAMWRRVSAGIERRRAHAIISPAGGRRRAFVPALAAAVAVLVFTLGFLLSEIRHLRQSETRLLSMIQSQEKAIDLVLARNDETAAGAPMSFGGRGELKAGELLAMLGRLDPDVSVLGAAETGRLLAGWNRFAFLALLAGGDRIETADGIQAGELAALIRASGVSPETRIPARLVNAAARGRGRPGMTL